MAFASPVLFLIMLLSTISDHNIEKAKEQKKKRYGLRLYQKVHRCHQNRPLFVLNMYFGWRKIFKINTHLEGDP